MLVKVLYYTGWTEYEFSFITIWLYKKNNARPLSSELILQHQSKANTPVSMSFQDPELVYIKQKPGLQWAAHTIYFNIKGFSHLSVF